MFNIISSKISNAIRGLFSTKKLTEKNIKDILNTVKVSLLEGDVALPVVNNFVNQVKKSVLAKKISSTNLTPSQVFVKSMYDSLVKIMGSEFNDLNLYDQIPAILLLIGPQGSGKTTTVAKLAKFLSVKKNKKVLVVSVDIYRPAGIYQLKKIIEFEPKISFFSDYDDQDNPIDIIDKSIILSKLKCYDVLLVDTAGCLDTDYVFLEELSKIYRILNPIETLFVVDSMTGQVVVNSIKEFNKLFPLTGVILTKLDGDTRGGVALSIKYLTGKPIKFIGVGEGINELEPFYPNRISSRILGMGDVLTLIENIEHQEKFDKNEKFVNTEDLINFTMYDFLKYLKKIRNMGGIEKIISKLPNFVVPNYDNKKLFSYEKECIIIESIINSMTRIERINPNIINDSRKKRIANGAGVSIQEVEKLLDKFHYMRATMKKLNKNGMLKMTRIFKDAMPFSFFKN